MFLFSYVKNFAVNYGFNFLAYLNFMITTMLVKISNFVLEFFIICDNLLYFNFYLSIKINLHLFNSNSILILFIHYSSFFAFHSMITFFDFRYINTTTDFSINHFLPLNLKFFNFSVSSTNFAISNYLSIFFSFFSIANLNNQPLFHD